MKRYIIRPFTAWTDIEPLSISENLWLPPTDIAAWAQIARDGEALRVRLTAREQAIRAVETGPLGRPCEDSCLEFFLSPMPGDARYINIEFNPSGCMWLGMGDGRFRTRLLPEEDWFQPKPFRTHDGWGVEYRVPFDFLRTLFPGFFPAPGHVLRANCYKCGDKTDRPHYLAWNPVASDTPNFHRPRDFGEMPLE